MVFVVAASFAPAPVPAAEPTGDQIVSLVIDAARNREREDVGTFSRRATTVRMLDPDDGAVESTKEIDLEVWEYHGEHPTRKVRACRIDGTDVDLEECEEKQQLEPAYRLFGPDSEKHYRFEYGGEGEWEGAPTHKIRIVPLDETPRHLKGDIHVLREGFRVVGFDVTLADYPLGLEALAIRLTFKRQDGAPVLDHGSSDVTIYVPLVMHERRVTEFRASEQRRLRERVAIK